jgi:hypothetical protein
MLDEINVSIEDLFLDPNNPRFIKNFEKGKTVPDKLIEGSQKQVLKNFSKNPQSDNEDVTNISDLYESMRTIGYVPIDRIVVRPVEKSNKFVVIEGNRRISTIKTLRNDFINHEGVLDKTKERKKYEKVKDSFENITCMLLRTEGLTDQEISYKISVILGLRHHGSLLEWDPLPKAYNIYKEYMNIEPKLPSFEFKNDRRNEVSNMLSISKPKVTSSLKTYIVYLQLCDHFEVKDRYYSLIQECVTNKNLQGTLFKIDSSTYKLDEISLDKFNEVCQFANRDNLPENKRKIIENPQKVSLLGKLFAKRMRAKHETVKSYADDLIQRTLDADDLDMPLEAAVDDLTAFENRTFWVDTIEKLLLKQDKELKFDDYTGIGNDLGKKEQLKKTLEPLRKIMGV